MLYNASHTSLHVSAKCHRDAEGQKHAAPRKRAAQAPDPSTASQSAGNLQSSQTQTQQQQQQQQQQPATAQTEVQPAAKAPDPGVTQAAAGSQAAADAGCLPTTWTGKPEDYRLTEWVPLLLSARPVLSKQHH